MSEPRRITADYFDGHSARAQPVDLEIAGGQLLLHAADGSVLRTIAMAELHWPERQRHGPRQVHLDGGASLQVRDSAGWDAWTREHKLGETLVVRAQQSWRATAIAATLLVVLALAGYLWGLPPASRLVVAALPAGVEDSVGKLALESMQHDLLEPSRLPAARQQALRSRFEQALARAYPNAGVPPHSLHFHSGRAGANAFALPGGSIVITDKLVETLAGHDDVIVGVLAHELGHVEHRHSMRMLVQASLLGVATGLAFGDFSGWLASVPALLGQLAYSRDFEREADATAIAVLRANGIAPSVMNTLFDKLGAAEGGAGLLSSHPADAERRRRFEAAGR